MTQDNDLREIDHECQYLREMLRDEGGSDAKRMIAIINLTQIFLRDVRRIANAIEAISDEV